MSQAKKKNKGGISRQNSVQKNTAQIEELQREEMQSMEAIFDTDFKLILDQPGQPLHFQILVKPAPNEPDAANHCTVLLDVMLTPTSTPLLVVRKQKALSAQQIEQLQQAIHAEADRLFAKGDEQIIYSIVLFMVDWLLPHNIPPRSFHEQMVERAARSHAEQAAAAQEKQQASKIAEDQEKQLLKKSIEAVQAKKLDALVKKQNDLITKRGGGAGSVASSPLSNSASPASLSISPLHSLPVLTLGAASLASASSSKPAKSSTAAPAPTSSKSSQQSTPITSPSNLKKSANIPVPEPMKKVQRSDSSGVSLNTTASKPSKQPAPTKRPTDVHSRLQAKAHDRKKSGKFKPRELRERSHDGLSEESGSGEEEEESGEESGEDDEDEESQSGSEEDDDDEDGDRDFNDEDETLFAAPTSTFTKKSGGASSSSARPLSDIDKLMREIELKEAKEAKTSTKAAAAASKRALQKHHSSGSELSGDDQDDGEDGEDEDMEDEEDEDEDEPSDTNDSLSPSPTIGPAGAAWLERNVSGTSSEATHREPPPAIPALPYYSRFYSDFEQLELLGKGGFGEVYKVRNKVDKLFYAVKRIKLKKKNPAMNRKIVKEVSMIAMLHHRYIVRYYQAWIEGEENTVDEDDSKLSALANAAASSSAVPSKKPALRRKSTRTMTEFNLAEDDEDWLSPSHPSTMGPDDEDEDEEDESDYDDDDSTPRTTAAQSGQMYLYVQMELCAHKTLRNIIDEKVFETNPEDCWRLFRQLLEAVAFIHKKNVVHRDLKPLNVFIAYSDSVSQVKLGDFGLASFLPSSTAEMLPSSASFSSSLPTPSTLPGAANASVGGLSMPPNQRSVSDLEANPIGLSRQDSMTGGVGTHFYSAPEQRRGASYDHRVDLFSLGIIFFEMVYPFGSLMERALQLEELRATGKVPNEFLVGRPDRLNIIKIIESLLSHKPEDRPTASELLKSGLIPLKIEDEYMELALKSVSQRDSVHHTRLLDMLFAMPPDEHIDFTFDYLSVSSRADTAHANAATALSTPNALRDAPLHFHQLCSMRVFDTVSHIFRNHGAIYLSTPIITPKSNIGGTKANTAVYLDPQGTCIKLPYTLTVPFARYIAQQSGWIWSGAAQLSKNSASGLTSSPSDTLSCDPAYHFDLRRYDISKVYRKNIIGGRPKELYECDFDIVWSSPNNEGTAGTSACGMTSSSSSSSLSHMKDSRATAREKLCCLSAEVIKLTHEVLTEFVPAIGTTFVIKVNHSDLFDAILDVVLADTSHVHTSGNSTPSGKSQTAKEKEDSMTRAASLQAQQDDIASLRRDLCKLASSYALFQGSWSKSPMRRQLLREKKLTTKKIDLLGALFQLKSEPGKPVDAIFQKIRDALFSIPEARYVLKEHAIIEQLELIRSVFEYLRLSHHVDTQVIFDVSICGKHELYSGGIVFQALVPNTNMDLSSSMGGSSSSNERHASIGDMNDLASSNASDAITQNAYETIALGGQYDTLIESFAPPTAGMPLSAVGVNFAIEKIVNAVVAYSLKPTSKSIVNNPTVARRIKKSLYGGDAHHSTILLFGMKNALLKERLALANEIWSDNLPCLYIHPSHMTLGNVRHYAKEYMIRWLVIFKRDAFRENSHVQVLDLASASLGRSNEKNPAEAISMPVSTVCGYIRQRLLGKKEIELNSSTSNSSSSSSSSSSKPIHYTHIIDHANIKSSVKNKILTEVKKCAALASINNNNSAVCAVDLPFALIRTLSSAFYLGPQQLQAAVEECHARQRDVCNQLVAYIYKRCGGAPVDTHTISSAKTSKEKLAAMAASAQEALKERVEILYIYSVPDRKADMILNS